MGDRAVDEWEARYYVEDKIDEYVEYVITPQVDTIPSNSLDHGMIDLVRNESRVYVYIKQVTSRCWWPTVNEYDN